MYWAVMLRNDPVTVCCKIAYSVHFDPIFSFTIPTNGHKYVGQYSHFNQTCFGITMPSSGSTNPSFKTTSVEQIIHTKLLHVEDSAPNTNL